MVELIASPDPERIRENLARVRGEIERAGARAGRWTSSERPAAVEVLAATKYVASAGLPALARAGVSVVGENRAQDLQEKVAVHGELFAGTSSGRCRVGGCARSCRTCA